MNTKAEKRTLRKLVHCVALAAAVCALVASLGCQSTKGRKSCLFGGGCQSDESDLERGQEKNADSAPNPPQTDAVSSLDAADSKTTFSAATTGANFAEARSRVEDASANGSAFIQNSAAPDAAIVSAPDANAQALDFGAAAPNAEPAPKYLSVQPAPDQGKANETRRELNFVPQTYDYSASLPTELKAGATLFGFESTETAVGSSEDVLPLPEEFSKPDALKIRVPEPNNPTANPPAESRESQPPFAAAAPNLNASGRTYALKSTALSQVVEIPQARATSVETRSNGVGLRPSQYFPGQVVLDVEGAGAIPSASSQATRPSQYFPGQRVLTPAR